MYHVAVLLLAHLPVLPHPNQCNKKSPAPPPVAPVPPLPKTPSAGACPIDTLELDACIDLLGGLAHAVIGQNTKDKCCTVIQDLADLDAALCLCTTIKAKVFDFKVLLPIALELLVDCGLKSLTKSYYMVCYIVY
ncbi:AAI [Musa troglodytarum]|uniref:AAI n=1 Tax=Musa troglodytarum TaxID=320322 RepID=A0A9E7JPY2_9LILI|nr:AAI [Musa troglodytarum]